MVNVLKIYYNTGETSEVRRIPATGSLLTEFVSLQLKIGSLFQFSDIEEITISWLDDDNDYIRITCDDELAQAKIEAEEQKLDILRLFVNHHKTAEMQTHPNTNVPLQVLHPQVVCDSCDKEISGFRYKCLECPDYDLCSGCNASDAHPTHDMMKLTRPSYIARKWIFQGAPRMWKSMFQPSINRFYKSHFQGSEDGAKTKPGADKPQCGSTKPEFVELYEELFGKVDETSVKTAADLPEALKGIFPAPAIQLFHEGLNHVKNFLEDVAAHPAKENATPGSKQAPSTSTSAQTKTPVASDQSTQVEASSSANTETGTSPAEATPMDIGSNQMPTEVEDVECVDEIIVDPENGTTQTQEQPKLPEDWTLLDADISSSSRMDCGPTSCGEAVPKPTQKVVYPNLVDVVDPAPKPQENPNYIRSRDPKIRSAVMTMNGMGFSNEGGWLETLLISKNGNINETLESLYPTMR